MYLHSFAFQSKDSSCNSLHLLYSEEDLRQYTFRFLSVINWYISVACGSVLVGETAEDILQLIYHFLI